MFRAGLAAPARSSPTGRSPLGHPGDRPPRPKALGLQTASPLPLNNERNASFRMVLKGKTPRKAMFRLHFEPLASSRCSTSSCSASCATSPCARSSKSQPERQRGTALASCSKDRITCCSLSTSRHSSRADFGPDQAISSTSHALSPASWGSVASDRASNRGRWPQTEPLANGCPKISGLSHKISSPPVPRPRSRPGANRKRPRNVPEAPRRR